MKRRGSGWQGDKKSKQVFTKDEMTQNPITESNPRFPFPSSCKKTIPPRNWRERNHSPAAKKGLISSGISERRGVFWEQLTSCSSLWSSSKRLALNEIINQGTYRTPPHGFCKDWTGINSGDSSKKAGPDLRSCVMISIGFIRTSPCMCQTQLPSVKLGNHIID